MGKWPVDMYDIKVFFFDEPNYLIRTQNHIKKGQNEISGTSFNPIDSRFLMGRMRSSGSGRASRFIVVENWLEEFRDQLDP